MMDYKLQELIDIPKLQEILDSLNEAFTLGIAIIDNDSNVLTYSGWQDICTLFHRRCSISEMVCRRHNHTILGHLNEIKSTITFRCPHGMTNVAVPIIIDSKHLGNMFIGQIFLEEPDLEFFRKQAQRYDFDENAYLEAVRKVPILTRNGLERKLPFIRKFTEILGGMGMKHLKELDNERQLRQSEERYHTLFDNTSDGILILDIDGYFLAANSVFLMRLGYREEELLGRTPALFNTPEYAAFVPARLRKLKETEIAIFETEYASKDGTVFPVEVSARVVTLSGQKAIIAIIRDISERKRVQAELAIALDIEKKVNEEQRLFLGVISHELRTPLSIIDGAAQLINFYSNRQSKNLLQTERILSATRRLADLIETCLMDEKLSKTGYRLEIQPVDIISLALDTVRQVQAKSDKNVIDCTLCDLPDHCNCDAVLVRMMLGNLLDNAVKYSPGGGGIHLCGWSDEEGNICFEVADQGIGIAPEQFERIFDRFYRIGQIHGIPGAGLGLHLVKLIAELHGGGVACKSEIGHGSVFTVQLKP